MKTMEPLSRSQQQQQRPQPDTSAASADNNAFEYDETLLEACSRCSGSLFPTVKPLISSASSLVKQTSEHERYNNNNNTQEQLLALLLLTISNSTNEQACWDLFVQHGQHFRRPIRLSSLGCSMVIQQDSSQSQPQQQQTFILMCRNHDHHHHHQQQLLLVERFQRFVKSVQLVHEHNNRRNKDMSSSTSSTTTPSFQLTLNQFSDVLPHHLPIILHRTNSKKNLMPHTTSSRTTSTRRRQATTRRRLSSRRDDTKRSNDMIENDMEVDNDNLAAWLLQPSSSSGQDDITSTGVHREHDDDDDNSSSHNNRPAFVRLANWNDIQKQTNHYEYYSSSSSSSESSSSSSSSSSWGIGHGSINRFNVHVPHHHHHYYESDQDDSEHHHHNKKKKPQEFAVPVDQSAFAQVPFPDDDVAVNKLDGKELAIKQQQQQQQQSPTTTSSTTSTSSSQHHHHHHKHHQQDDEPPSNATQNEIEVDNLNNTITKTTDDDEIIEPPPPPPTYLNWATTDNPDGVPLVHDVFDQGKCGSCWAFAATGTLETSVARRAAYVAYMDYIRNGDDNNNNTATQEDRNASYYYYGGKPYFPAAAVSAAQQVERDAFAQVNLSIQELVDCDTSVDRGCTGGNPLLAFYYIHRYGLTTWDAYPYVGFQDKCHVLLPHGRGRRYHPIATVTSWGVLTPNHEDNIELVLRTIGPVAVGFNGADPAFLAYQRGIFDHPTCGQSANHALLIVGFGQEEQLDGSLVKYWIARNSWGKGWGENGYVRVKRGNGAKGTRGVCGIARSPSVALGGTWIDGNSGICNHMGSLLGGICESAGSRIEGHKALFFGLLAMLFTGVGIILPLTADCRRRRRRRKERRLSQPRHHVGTTLPHPTGQQQQTEATYRLEFQGGETLPLLLQNGTRPNYVGGLT